MFAAIYQGYLKPGREAEYQEAWHKVAVYFVEHRGALGSTLHRTDNGMWVAYSRWPDKATRDASWPGENAPASELPDTIHQAIILIKDCLAPEPKFSEICLEVMDDLLLGKTPVAHYQAKLQYEIDSWDLNQALKKGEGVVVIDARSKEAYQNEHIPGAINFPHRTMNQDSTAERLDRKLEYVTYCDGIGCNASTKGALKLAQLGYKVKELIGGIDWWKRDGYSVETDQQLCSVQYENNCGCDDLEV